KPFTVRKKGAATECRPYKTPAALLLFYIRTSNNITISRTSRWNNERLAHRHHDVVTTDDVGKLIEIALAPLIDRFITFDVDVAIVFHARSGRNQPAHDDVLFESAQVIDAARNCSLGEHARGLLERCGRDKRVGRERRLRDTKQQRLGLRDFAVSLPDALVLILEAETIDLLFEQKLGGPHFLNLHPAQHLSNNHCYVLVVDVHTLQAIDLLNFVYEILLQTTHSQHAQNIVRIQRAVH